MKHKYYPRSRRELRCAKRRRRHFSHFPALSTGACARRRIVLQSNDTRCRAHAHFSAILHGTAQKRHPVVRRSSTSRAKARLLAIWSHPGHSSMQPPDAIFTDLCKLALPANYVTPFLINPTISHGNCISIVLCPSAALPSCSPPENTRCTSCFSTAKCRRPAMIRF